MTCTPSPPSGGCQIISGGAEIGITVPGPACTFLTVYELDQAGNESGWQTQTFTGAADNEDAYTGGASLAANSTAALGAGKSYDNQMISTQAGQAGRPTARAGASAAFDEAQLSAAGWDPGKAVTVTGPASRCRPSARPPAAPRACGPTGNRHRPDGAQGSGLVFLRHLNGQTVVGGAGRGVAGGPDAGVTALGHPGAGGRGRHARQRPGVQQRAGLR